MSSRRFRHQKCPPQTRLRMVLLVPKPSQGHKYKTRTHYRSDQNGKNETTTITLKWAYIKKKLTREIQNNAQRWHLSVANCPIGNQLSIKLTGGDQKFTPFCTPKRYQFHMYPMRYQNYPDSSQFRFKHPWWSQIKNFNTKKVQHIYIRVPSGAGGGVNCFYLLVFAVNKVQNQTKQAKQYSKTGQNIENNSYTGTVL